MLKGVHQKLEPQQTPAFFVRGPTPLSRLVFFGALSLVMMAVDARFHTLEKVRVGFISALHPLEIIANAPSQWLRSSQENLQSRSLLLQENARLKQASLEQNVKLQRLNHIWAENAHLRSLLKGDAPIRLHAVLGEILNMGRDPFTQVVVINRGSQHQVLAGQAVIDAKGVIGQVTRVYPYTSEVTLITDKELAIPVQIARNQLRAIAFGAGKDRLIDIPYLPTNVDIQVGDKLVTSGIDGTYPAGLAVSEITQVTLSPDSPFAKIVSKPMAGVSTHLQVLVLNYDAEKQDAEKRTASIKQTDSKEILKNKPAQIIKKTQ